GANDAIDPERQRRPRNHACNDVHRLSKILHSTAKATSPRVLSAAPRTSVLHRIFARPICVRRTAQKLVPTVCRSCLSSVYGGAVFGVSPKKKKIPSFAFLIPPTGATRDPLCPPRAR